MSKSTKPRKKYKHDPFKKYEHPALRKADSEENLRVVEALKENIEDAEHGSNQQGLICATKELLHGVLIALDGWSVDVDVISRIVCSMDFLKNMANDGFIWDSKIAAELIASVDEAIQVMNQLPMRDASMGFIQARNLSSFVKECQGINTARVLEAP